MRPSRSGKTGRTWFPDARSRIVAALAAGGVVWFWIQTALASSGNSGEGGAGSHVDPFAPIILTAALVMLVAVIGRGLASSGRQPAVLGELLIGVILGNLGYHYGSDIFVVIMHLNEGGELYRAVWSTGLSLQEAAREVYPASALEPGQPVAQLLDVLTGSHAERKVSVSYALWIFSNMGLLLLLFMVGLETSVEEMMEVGLPSIAVAILGVITPFGLGYGLSIALMPESGAATHLFIAATLCATSVGIAARVFKDLGRLKTPAAKVILGAAVIDDVLGLIILAVVVGIVTTGQIEIGAIGQILGISTAFLGVVVILGPRLVGYGVPLFDYLDHHNIKLLYPLALCFIMSWMASEIGLAAIVGAFAAGLIISEGHFSHHKGSTMQSLIAPLEALFAPVFFVLMGMQVNLTAFLAPGVIWLALGLIVVAFAGKIVAGLPAGKNIDRLTVGVGMVPRGEVGLIFAGVGKSMGVVSDAVFSAIVMMVIVTTLATPIALRWTIKRYETRNGRDVDADADAGTATGSSESESSL